jgi:hypothetical protein
MYDSISARSIYNANRNPDMVAGYIDKIKLEPWTSSDWELFPNAAKVQIVKKASTNAGHVLDVEPGDATPAQAPGWVKMRRAKDLATPTIYCNLSTWQSVIDQFNSQRVAQPLYWIAKYDNKPEFLTKAGITCIAKQYHGNDPKNYDLSYVADYWPGVDREQNEMAALDLDSTVKLWDGTIITWANLLRDIQGRVADVRLAHYGTPSGGDPFGAAVFTDNPNTPEARSIRVRDFFGELRSAAARIATVEAKLNELASRPEFVIPTEAEFRQMINEAVKANLKVMIEGQVNITAES